ncbi:MAG: thioredoxin domain-containing protein [Candidatus Zambryskibacteria bacterium]|nr:thioredoxin domain-containing protein [Candidatus Zambryskibacteria bacterium]
MTPLLNGMNMEKLSVPIAVVISGALIAGALYYSNVKAPIKAVNNAPIVNTNVGMKPVSADDHILGNPNADLIIVEYSDTECPYCKVFHNTLQRVMNEYGKDGRVAWVYRHFPIDSNHPKARKESEAMECANELGSGEKFWEYTNLLYQTTNSNNSLDPAELPKMAKAVGLDVTAFNTCLSSGKYAAKIEASVQDAQNAGAQGTPYSVIISKDGTKTPITGGAVPYESLKPIIDALLQ